MRVGEGRISGYLSIALGMLNLLAVLCFMALDTLTTPSLQAAHDLSLMRKLLAAGMVFSAGFGLLTFLVNRQKRPGSLGIVLTLIAAYLGGSLVQVGSRYHTVGYIGLDWSILDLLASASTFIALEMIVPHRREQPISRPYFWHDSRCFIFNHLILGISPVHQRARRAEPVLVDDQCRSAAMVQVIARHRAVRGRAWSPWT